MIMAMMMLIIITIITTMMMIVIVPMIITMILMIMITIIITMMMPAMMPMMMMTMPAIARHGDIYVRLFPYMNIEILYWKDGSFVFTCLFFFSRCHSGLYRTVF